LGNDQVYWPVTVAYSDTQDIIGSGTWVTAELRNDAAFPMQDVQAVTWSYFSQAHGIERVLAADILCQGATVTFVEFLYAIGGTSISNIRISAQGIIRP